MDVPVVTIGVVQTLAALVAVIYARDAARSGAAAAIAAHDTVAEAAKARREDELERKRERISDILGAVSEVRVLARRLWEVDSRTLEHVGSDESALIPLQVALVALRARLQAFRDDELPAVRELSMQPVRAAEDANRIWGNYCANALDEVGSSLRELRELRDTQDG